MSELSGEVDSYRLSNSGARVMSLAALRQLAVLPEVVVVPMSSQDADLESLSAQFLYELPPEGPDRVRALQQWQQVQQ